MMLVIALVVGILVGLVVSLKVTGSKWSKAYDELTNKFKNSMETNSKLLGQVKDLRTKNTDLLEQSLDLLEQNLDLSEKVRTLTKQNSEYRSKAKLYDKIWEEQADKAQEIIFKVVDTIADEIDQITNTDNVKLGFENETTVNNGSYGYNTDDNGNIVEEQILVSPIVIFDDRKKRHIDYLNKEFGLRLAYDYKTAIIMTFLHETGHCIDYHTRNDIKDYANKNQELKAQLSELKSQEESDYQYRQVPNERYADEFAVKMIKKYYPELAYAC